MLSESLEEDFVLQTVMQMKENYGITLNAETMIHSDQGCHYTCIQFIELVKDSGLRQSMSRRGNCWDNAPQESFYGHMKDELAEKMAAWETFEDAKRDIDDWFDYYNTERYQWQLAKLSPNQYYKYVTTGEYPLPSKPEEESSRGSALDPGIYRMFLRGSSAGIICGQRLLTKKRDDTVQYRPLGSQPALGSHPCVALSSDRWQLKFTVFSWCVQGS